MKLTTVFIMVCLLAACVPSPDLQAPAASGAQTAVVTIPARATVTPYPAPTRRATWTPEPSATPATLLLTPDPLLEYTIPALRLRPYGGGEVENLGVLSNQEKFTRYSIRYPSDGLNIYGFVNVPLGEGPFPIIVVLHGYTDPARYETLDYTTPVADSLAALGYIVLHPNMRNFAPSDRGNTLFRVGYAIDVLNLIAMARESAGKPGLFERANPSGVGLWGHSMGGDIALKVAVVNPAVKAVLLYASMSGDERKNSEFFFDLTGSSENEQELQAPAQLFDIISPDRYYRELDARIQLHHGTADTVIPVSVARATCAKLKEVGQVFECFFYEGAEHTFRAKYTEEYFPRMRDFFARNLKK